MFGNNKDKCIFSYKEKFRWGLYIKSILELSSIKDNQDIRANAYSFVKDLVLPGGTWNSVTDKSGFDNYRFRLLIQDACKVCAKSHPEWFI